MPNVDGFNQELDKITEREVVYDFVSRLTIGKDMMCQDTGKTSHVLFPAKTNFKRIVAKIASMLPTKVMLNMDNIQTKHWEVKTGTQILVTHIDGEILAIYSEQLGMDILRCFTKGNPDSTGHNVYSMTLDVPYTNDDTLKIYYI